MDERRRLPRAVPAAVSILALAVLIAGCGAGSPPGEEGGSPEARSDAEAAAAGDDGARVALEATGPDELPPALVGTAPPPRGRDLRYFEGDSAAVGYLAVPDGEGPFPAVVLIHEWNGLVDRVRQVADALAAEGYVALAADLFRGRTGSSREENMALVREARGDPSRMIANLDAAVEYLRGRPDVTGRIGAMGWCFGGGVALTFGLDGANHEATAIFYGSLLDDPERLASLEHEVYGTFAEQDSGIPPDDVRGFVEALEGAGVPNDVHIYDGVDHGFWLWVDEDPDARRAPALDAWQRLKAYLDRALAG